MDVEDRVAIVTGASSGIGAATARLMHQHGAHVVMAARRGELLLQLADELPGSIVIAADVTDDEARREVVGRTLDAHGRIDVLVNNAGQGLHVPLDEVSLDAFRDVLELNLVAPLALMQLVWPVMRTQRSGAIVNISSGTSRMALPGVGAYAATKAALNLLSATARKEFAADGISVSLVLPTVAATHFHDVLRQGVRPDRRLPFAGVPAEEVATAILRAVETGEEEIALAHSR